MRAYRIILILLSVFLIIPSVSFAEDETETGWELYQNIKLLEERPNFQNVEDVLDSSHTLGYLKGFLDAVTLVQDFMFEKVFPSKVLSESEREKSAKEMNFHRINIPEGGISVGQLELIFKKYAEDNSKKLNESARVCLLNSIIEAYGWK